MEVKMIPENTVKKPSETLDSKRMPTQKGNTPFFNKGTLSDGEPGKSPYSGGHGMGFQLKEKGENEKKPAREGYHDSMLETVGMISRLPPEQQSDPEIMKLAKNLLEKMELVLEAKQPRKI